MKDKQTDKLLKKVFNSKAYTKVLKQEYLKISKIGLVTYLHKLSYEKP